jgi:hypothetical protein
MKIAKLTAEASQMLIGKKIISTGDDYITLDNGCRIYLDEDEIINLNPDSATMFLISGYWKDDKSEFSDYLVNEYDDDLGNTHDDVDIFYYGLSESEIIDAIKQGEETALEFVITEYKPF